MTVPIAVAANALPHTAAAEVPLSTRPDTPDADPAVSGLMTTKVIGIVPDAPLAVALNLMADTAVRHLPVIAGLDCVGVLVESDVIERLAEGQGSLAAAPITLVSEICRPAPPTVALSGHRSDVTLGMVASGLDAVLVTDRGRIVGIVTGTDVIRSLAGKYPPGSSAPQ